MKKSETLLVSRILPYLMLLALCFLSLGAQQQRSLDEAQQRKEKLQKEFEEISAALLQEKIAPVREAMANAVAQTQASINKQYETAMVMIMNRAPELIEKAPDYADAIRVRMLAVLPELAQLREKHNAQIIDYGERAIEGQEIIEKHEIPRGSHMMREGRTITWRDYPHRLSKELQRIEKIFSQQIKQKIGFIEAAAPGWVKQKVLAMQKKVLAPSQKLMAYLTPRSLVEKYKNVPLMAELTQLKKSAESLKLFACEKDKSCSQEEREKIAEIMNKLSSNVQAIDTMIAQRRGAPLTTTAFEKMASVMSYPLRKIKKGITGYRTVMHCLDNPLCTTKERTKAGLGLALSIAGTELTVILLPILITLPFIIQEERQVEREMEFKRLFEQQPGEWGEVPPEIPGIIETL